MSSQGPGVTQSDSQDVLRLHKGRLQDSRTSNLGTGLNMNEDPASEQDTFPYFLRLRESMQGGGPLGQVACPYLQPACALQTLSLLLQA
jgi:hypothetical protein